MQAVKALLFKPRVAVRIFCCWFIDLVRDRREWLEAKAFDVRKKTIAAAACSREKVRL